MYIEMAPWYPRANQKLSTRYRSNPSNDYFIEIVFLCWLGHPNVMQFIIRLKNHERNLQCTSLSGIFEALHQVSIPSSSLTIKEKSCTCRDISSVNVLLKAKPNNQWRAKLSYFGSTKLTIEAKTTCTGPVYAAPRGPMGETDLSDSKGGYLSYMGFSSVRHLARCK